MSHHVNWHMGSRRYLVILCLVLFGGLPGWVRAAEYIKSDIPSWNRPTEPANLPVDLAVGPQLFVDSYLIAEAQNVTRTVHPPLRYEQNPILGFEQGTTQPYLTVLRDEKIGKFRMWYNRDIGKKASIAYAESEDGIHWTLPNLDVLDGTNRLVMISGEEQNAYGVTVIDDGLDGAANPNERYKMAWWSAEKPFGPDFQTPIHGGPGMYVATSPDGLHWTRNANNPVLGDWSEKAFHDDSRRSYGVGDIIDVYRDPLLGQYSVFLKTPAVPADGVPNGPRGGGYLRRFVSFSESGDFKTWARPRRVILPEERDAGILEFYGVGGTIVRGTARIGFVRMLHDDYAAIEGGPSDGIGYTTLVTSRDGLYWDRHDEIFFDRDHTPDSWDHAMTWVGHICPVGDEYYIYYGGYKSGHKVEPEKERQIGLARMKRDRFVSQDAGETPGTLKTVTLHFNQAPNPALTLNAATSGSGSIRVRVLNQQGDPVAGYGFEDCNAVQGDGLALPVTWKNHAGLEVLRDRLFKLEFQLENAQLYAFDVR